MEKKTTIDEAAFDQSIRLFAAQIESGDYKPDVFDFSKELVRIYAQVLKARSQLEEGTAAN